MPAILENVVISQLIDQFWVFYSEVMRLKRVVTEQQTGSALAAVNDVTQAAAAPDAGKAEEAKPGDGRPEAGVRTRHVSILSAPDEPITPARMVATTLQRMLEQFAMTAARQGGEYARSIHNEALYVMAALADEVFLHDIEWPDKQAYRSVLVESLVFRSHVAGEQVFTNLERLLETRDPVQAELAIVYLLALALGFRGKYRRIDDYGQIGIYRRQLYHFVLHRPADIEASSLRISPSAYDHTLREGGGFRLKPLRRWVIRLACVVGVLLVASHAIWVINLIDVKFALDRVFAVAVETAR